MKHLLEHMFLCLGWFAMVAGTLLICIVFYWLNFPYTPLVINSPIQILTKEVKGKDNVMYAIDYCKNMELPATLTKEYIDGVVYAAPPIITNNQKGCGTTVGMTLIPNLPSGKYKIRFSYVYKVNPLRDVTVVAESDTFLLVEE